MTGLVKLLLRTRLREQLYLGIGVAVALTLGASVVAWVSFQNVGDAQRRVNEGSVPEMATAFVIAQEAQALAGAAPEITVAGTRMGLEATLSQVRERRTAFLEHVDLLVGIGERGQDAQSVQERGRELAANLGVIESSAEERFELADRSKTLRDTLREVEATLSSMLVTAIDDQYFYALTGHRELNAVPDAPEQHFTMGEVNTYRRLAELHDSAAIGTQVLANAFSLTDSAQLEPLRERFEATTERINRHLEGLGTSPLVDQLEPLFRQLIGLSVQEDGIFDIRESELELEGRQRDLLASNQAIASDLVSAVEMLVSDAQDNALQAARASEDTIATGRRLLLALNLISVAGALLIAWGFVGRVLLRRLELVSSGMHRMAEGDLESKVEIEGQDEVADMAAALEVFRRHALEVQRLNLVEKLADELQGKNEEMEKVLADLQKAQGQIVMREKLAALGELTAGVAHEIKNPLNFIKNFSEVSEELIGELDDVLPKDGQPTSGDWLEEVQDICEDLTENLKVIRQHSDRANRIVHDMLQMGRDAGDRYSVDINLLVKEHSNLAYHSARATDSEFQLDIRQDLDPNMGELVVVPQELGRVILNLVSNACYATNEKRQSAPADYVPTLRLVTRRTEERAEICVRDNGNGMPKEVQEKMFNPFFTTKPTNQGTGLGLSLSNDIVREHGGRIRVQSESGEYTEMVIDLPIEQAAVQDAAD